MTVPGVPLADRFWPSAAVGMARIDPEHGTIAEANDVLTRAAGRPLAGAELTELTSPGQRAALGVLVAEAGPGWTSRSVGLFPDADGVPADYVVWARREPDAVLVVAEPHVGDLSALNGQLLALNGELVEARRSIAHAAEAERAARRRAEAVARRLDNLYRIADSALSSLSLDELLDELLERLAEALGVDVLQVLLLEPRGRYLEPRAARGLPDGDPARERVPWGRGVAGRVARDGEPLRLAGLEGVEVVSPSLAAAVRSLASVPLRVGGELTGVLHAGSARAQQLGDEEMELLGLAAERVALAIARARAFERERFIAAKLQESLLPASIPQVPGAELAGRYRPAGEGFRVGGDFYDVFDAGHGRHALMIGDVRGKGPEAAAVTALARSTARALAAREATPSGALAAVNAAMLAQGAEQPRHCTALLAFLEQEDETVRVELAAAGHEPGLVVRASGAVEELGAPGTLLGLFPEVELVDCRAALGPGDLLVLYTDGVTEARRGRQLLGAERLSALVAASAGGSAAAVAAQVEQAAADFTAGPLADDLAVVVVRATG